MVMFVIVMLMVVMVMTIMGMIAIMMMPGGLTTSEWTKKVEPKLLMTLIITIARMLPEDV